MVRPLTIKYVGEHVPSLGQSSGEGGMAERVTRIVASLNISKMRKEYALEPFSLLPVVEHQV